jgi:hypothetical protein
MQSEKGSYSMVAGRFNRNAWHNTRHSRSYRTGTVLSILVGLVFCLIIFLFVRNDGLTKNVARKQEKPRYEKSEVSSAVPLNDKIAVAD